MARTAATSSFTVGYLASFLAAGRDADGWIDREALAGLAGNRRSP
jgi:hypothetical protein